MFGLGAFNSYVFHLKSKPLAAFNWSFRTIRGLFMFFRSFSHRQIPTSRDWFSSQSFLPAGGQDLAFFSSPYWFTFPIESWDIGHVVLMVIVFHHLISFRVVLSHHASALGRQTTPQHDESWVYQGCDLTVKGLEIFHLFSHLCTSKTDTLQWCRFHSDRGGRVFIAVASHGLWPCRSASQLETLSQLRG